MESASGEVPSDPQLPTGRLRIPRCCLPPRLIQKRFISDISHVETETLNLILDPPRGRLRVCLDEVQVTDIADASIVRGLVGHLLFYPHPGH